uniref:Pre-rRNA-processing protein TSR2 homolog n=1 Tax=Gongylonema pulchrum TaxID=637853 RepID=A0A183DZI3_9BILA
LIELDPDKVRKIEKHKDDKKSSKNMGIISNKWWESSLDALLAWLELARETIEDLNECCELYGVSRIRQVLEAGNWRDKILKNNATSSAGKPISAMISDRTSPAAKTSEDSFDDDDMTEEDREMILELFGTDTPFASLAKDCDEPDPAVIEYFKLEAEKLKQQNKKCSKKQKKKPNKEVNVSEVNEFGEFVCANDSKKTSSVAVTQNSSTASSALGEQVEASRAVQENSGETVPHFSKCDESETPDEGSGENLREMSDVARSMIDGLIDKSTAQNETGKDVADLANKFEEVNSIGR